MGFQSGSSMGGEELVDVEGTSAPDEANLEPG